MWVRVVSIILAVVFLLGIVLGSVWAIWQSTRPENQPVDLTKVDEGQLDTEVLKLPEFEPLTEPIAQLEVEDLIEGEGDPIALDDTITVTYLGALASTGEVVEAVESETFGLGVENANLLEGWVQGLPGMKPGGVRRLLVPATLAYGVIGQPDLGIPPDADMIYDFELTGPADGGLDPTDTLADFAPTTEPVTELVIEDRVEGSGDRAAKTTDTVSVYYTGAFVSTGVVFDSSSRHGPDPVTFPLGGVIEGWTEGVAGMKIGGQRRLLIPSAKAYGERGFPPHIPPHSDLVFDIELVAINPDEGAGNQ